MEGNAAWAERAQRVLTPNYRQQPIALVRGEGVRVWDAGLARVSVFGPGQQYIRSFRVPTYWANNSMAFLSSG
jgi:hypothetical protein